MSRGLGYVYKRQVNESMVTGNIELYANHLEVLNQAQTPPFQLDEHVNVGEEVRLKYRYMDLRRPEMQKNLKLRSEVTNSVRNFLIEKGFLDIETPIMTRATPEGARDYVIPSRTYPGQFFAMPQSPQLFKQLLMVAGCDRYFQIAKCFRDEDLRADRQPEFTQIDIEASFVDREDILEIGEGLASIERKNRKRSINVTANVDLSVTNGNEVIATVMTSVLPKILQKHNSVAYSLEGEQQEQGDNLRSLGKNFLLAMIVVYMLLAIPFKSYFQPLVVMSSIPFGITGAVLGHIFLGLNLSVLSMMGIVALTGVVVNDSLVMVDFINRYRSEGNSITNAVLEAGPRRFRPIFLTSLTTFVGLIPLILEKSTQAKFMIPMAVSLSFGVLFATAITLLLVPVSYLTLEKYILKTETK